MKLCRETKKYFEEILPGGKVVKNYKILLNE